MNPLTSFKKSLNTLITNPSILFGSFLIGAFYAVLASFEPLESAILVSIALEMFFLAYALGGVYGVVENALQKGRTDTGAFFGKANHNYRTMLPAIIIVFIIPQTIFRGAQPLLNLLFTDSVGGSIGLLPYSLDPSILFLTISFISATVFVVPFTFLFLVQFFDAAIVTDDASVIESFRDSAVAVTQHPTSAMGYTIIRVGLFAAMYLPLLLKIYLDAQARIQQVQNTQPVQSTLFDPVLAAAIMISWTLIGGVLYTYHLIYYNELSSHSDNKPAKRN